MSILVTAGASPYFAFADRARFGELPAQAAAPESGANSADSADSDTAAEAGALSPAAQKQVAELKEIDRKVRAHEQAHMAVGRELIRGGISLTYQIGPDKQRYAVGGEVSIDASPASTPAKTISKADRIRATALAPADPSAQDQSVAAQASSMAAQARVELAVLQRQEPAARATKADGVQGGFYRGVEQSDQADSRIGALLDSFA